MFMHVLLLCVCVHARVYARVRACVCLYVRACVYLCVYVCVSVCISVRVHVVVCLYLRVCAIRVFSDITVYLQTAFYQIYSIGQMKKQFSYDQKAPPPKK